MKLFQLQLRSALFLTATLPLLIAGAFINYAWFLFGLCLLAIMFSRSRSCTLHSNRLDIPIVLISSFAACALVFWLSAGRQLIFIDNMAPRELPLRGKLIVTAIAALLGSLAISIAFWISRIFWTALDRKKAGQVPS